MSFKVEIFKNLDSRHLKTLWTDFERDHGVHPLLSYQAALSWWEAFNPRTNPTTGIEKQEVILVGIRYGNPVCIVPLMVTNRRSKGIIAVKSLEFMTQPTAFHWLDILHDKLSKREIAYLFSILKKKIPFHYLNLTHLSSRSPLFQAGTGRILPWSVQMRIPFEKEYNLTRKKYFSGHFVNHLEQLDRLRESHGLDIRFSLETQATSIRAMRADLVRLSRIGTGPSTASGLFQDPAMEGYFFDSFIQNKEVLLACCHINGSLAASALFIQTPESLLLAEAGQDMSLARKLRNDPWAWLIDQVIRASIGKTSEMVLGTGVEELKKGLTRNFEKLFCMVMPGRGLIAKLVYRVFKHRLEKEQKNLSKALARYVIPKEMGKD